MLILLFTICFIHMIIFANEISLTISIFFFEGIFYVREGS